MMINENRDCATESKLAITLRTLSKYDMSRLATRQTKKQTQRHRNWQIFRRKNMLKKQKGILTNRRTSRLTVDTRTQRGKQKMKNEKCSVVIQINK